MFSKLLSTACRTAADAEVEGLFSEDPQERNLSPKACRSALFIMLYRGYPMLRLPYRLLANLVEMDEQLSSRRSGT